jgi:tetratricopeptide (TPR) repeat protein
MPQAVRKESESSGWRSLVLTLGLLLLAAPAPAQGDAVVSRLRAERLAAEGRCEEAMPLLAKARAADPSDARAALVTGQCQINLRRYAEAIAPLEEAKRLDPDLAEVDLLLGMARFHQGDLNGAEEALKVAEQRLPDRAEVQLYIGLIALERGEAAQAALSLARSGRADPDAVEPIASFYEGRAYEIEGQRRAAEAALRRARDLGAGTIWESQATAALERLGEGEPPPWKATSPRELEILRERSPRWWVTTTFGLEYDDNVVLRGSGVQLPEEISSQNDTRGVASVEAGYEIFANSDWTVGVLANYWGSFHEDLEDFNAQFPGLSLWVDHRLLPETIGRFQYDFGYAWVGGSEPFLVSHNWTPAVYQNWGKAGTTRFFVRFKKRNYLFSNEDVPDGPGRPGSLCRSAHDMFCGPPGIDESRARNRDGWGLAAGFDHTWPVLGEKLVLRAGYRYHRFSARGSEYSFQAHEAQLGFRALLPFEFAFEAFGSYTWQPYRNRSTYPDPDEVFYRRQYGLTDRNRRDKVGRVDLVLERPITDYLMLSLRYAYFDNASNVDVFDYDREILGVYATFRFTP